MPHEGLHTGHVVRAHLFAARHASTSCCRGGTRSGAWRGNRMPCVWRGLLRVVDAVSTRHAGVGQLTGTGPGACG